MLCPQCQHENPTEAKFCLNCGTRLAQACPQCQQILPPEAKFCMACGHALTATSASDIPDSSPSRAKSSLPASPTPEAERRQLTVMFCDLAESTKLSGQLDPEDLRTVIRAYQETAAGVIQRYEGHIAQYLGDGLLVYFGWPQAHEDDAQRGVHVGLGIIEAMEDLNPRLQQDTGVQLTVRIGIHTGPVVIGEMGGGDRHELLALGETTNLAARLEGLAQPNTVVISDTTYRLVEGYFSCDDLGRHDLKGVATPMQTYQVREATDVQDRLDATMRHGLTPLVGREQEVAILLERWQQAKPGMGQVVFLSGEAGIGKSRLVQVLKDHIAQEPHTRLECRSSPYYQNTALYPITDLLQRALQWQQDETSEQRLEQLEQELSQYRLPLETSLPLLAPLLSIAVSEARYPPLTLSPERQRQKTLETIVAMWLEQTERQPVLFILEDLHWTDPTTLELLDLLIDQAPTASLLILLTCRPEFEPPWGLRSHLTPIALNRFTGSQIETMVERVTEGKTLPAEVVQHLVEKTDGVPLYVEEMTKAVLESGMMRDVNGHYELTGPLTSLSIPATLQDSLMARLDRLMTAKGIAQLGAVIGRQFSFNLLNAVSQLDESTLQHELGRLVEAELVYQRGLPPQATYLFKHALVVEAAYQSLLKSTRQQYHQRIAQVLEESFPETANAQPELLAHHYAEAGQNEAAISYWQQAGQRALQRSAHVEAIAHLRQGLTVLAMLPETPAHLQQELDLQVALGPALMATQGFGAPEVERAYGRARLLCQQVGETAQLFPVLWGLWRFYYIRAQYQTARELGEQCLSLARQVQDPALLLPAHHALGIVLKDLGDLPAAHDHMEQASALYDPQHHRVLASRYGMDFGVWCHAYAAWFLWLLGYPAQALLRGQAGLALAQGLSHPYSLAASLVYTAWLHQFRRESATARERAEAAIVCAREQGFPTYLILGTMMRGGALAAQGEGAEGMAQIRQGLDDWRTMGSEAGRSYYLILLAEACMQAGEIGAGLTALEEALAMIDATEERIYEAEVHRLRGELLLRRSILDAPQAATCFHQAITIAQSQSAKSWELRSATSLARLWQSQGKHGEAHELLAPVYNWFTEGFDTADLIDAKTLLDELTGAQS